MRKMVFSWILFVLCIWGFALAAQERVDLNSATVSEIQKVLKGTGVGLKKTQDLVEYRTIHGSFKTIDDVSKVKGIGPKTLIKMCPRIKLGEMIPECTISPPVLEKPKKASAIQPEKPAEHSTGIIIDLSSP